MQQLKQFKNHDFFGFKISMDFWMVFSLKMASKSRPFSMKKPSKKQDVFRASQKSFFLRSWSAPGQCPMAVFIFFPFFWIFGRKWLQKGVPKNVPLFCFLPPGTHQNRICDATSTFHRFPIDFGPRFHWFLLLLGPILDCFFAGSPFSPFPKYLPTNTDSPVSPQGCGGLRPAHTIWLLTAFLRPFSEKNACKNQCWIWTRKSDEIWWKINANMVWFVSELFLNIYRFRKVPNAKNVLKPTNFNDFRVRAIWKTIEKT